MRPLSGMARPLSADRRRDLTAGDKSHAKQLIAGPAGAGTGFALIPMPGRSAPPALKENAMKFELPMIAAFFVTSMLLCGYTLALMA